MTVAPLKAYQTTAFMMTLALLQQESKLTVTLTVTVHALHNLHWQLTVTVKYFETQGHYWTGKASEVLDKAPALHFQLIIIIMNFIPRISHTMSRKVNQASHGHVWAFDRDICLQALTLSRHLPISFILFISSEGVMISELWPWPSTNRSSSRESPERVMAVVEKSACARREGGRDGEREEEGQRGRKMESGSTQERHGKMERQGERERKTERKRERERSVKHGNRLSCPLAQQVIKQPVIG